MLFVRALSRDIHIKLVLQSKTYFNMILLIIISFLIGMYVDVNNFGLNPIQEEKLEQTIFYFATA